MHVYPFTLDTRSGFLRLSNLIMETIIESDKNFVCVLYSVALCYVKKNLVFAELITTFSSFPFLDSLF